MKKPNKRRMNNQEIRCKIIREWTSTDEEKLHERNWHPAYARR
jgi:hypothetical protein